MSRVYIYDLQQNSFCNMLSVHHPQTIKVTVDAVCFAVGNNIALFVLMNDIYIYIYQYHWRAYITGYTSVLKYVWFN